LQKEGKTPISMAITIEQGEGKIWEEKRTKRGPMRSGHPKRGLMECRLRGRKRIERRVEERPEKN